MSSTTLKRVFDILNDSSGAGDPRMNDGILTKSPLQLIFILTVYLLTVFKIGPKLMKDRKPFSLKNVMIFYNLIQIIFNAAIFILILPTRKKLNLLCSNPDTSNSDLNQLELKVHYLYLVLKFFDLIETVFYVLRKKDRQISFLHVYHHIGILFAAWVSGKYFPGGQALYVALYNTVIHCIMYCYYFVTSLNPNKPRSVWWKKYVTILQIIQHCMIFLSVFPAVVNVNCSYPKGWMAAFSGNVLLIIYLFVQFYKNTYLKPQKATD